MQRPLATVVIEGLVTFTLLKLLVLPTLYAGAWLKVALIQWRARIAPLRTGAYRVRVIYDICGLDPHLRANERGTRSMYRDRIVAETSVRVR